MKIEILDVAQHGEPFYAAYVAYIEELRSYTRPYGRAYAKSQPWWVNDPDSVVHVAWVDQQLAGFVINGWGRRVDADTASEILEFYVAPDFRGRGIGRQLATLAFAQLFDQAGFQVYLDNTKAERFWRHMLADQALPYTTYPAIDNHVPVVKYRFTAATTG